MGYFGGRVATRPVRDPVSLVSAVSGSFGSMRASGVARVGYGLQVLVPLPALRSLARSDSRICEFRRRAGPLGAGLCDDAGGIKRGG
jgi:hypothetical protein